MTVPSHLTWTENDAPQAALWRSDQVLPARIALADDTLSANIAYRQACEGTGLLWRGDFQNARQLLQAMTRRLDKTSKSRPSKSPNTDTPAPAAAFHKHRQAQAQRTRILSQILIELNADYGINLRRAPDVRQACKQAFGPPQAERSIISLRSLQGVIGAYEWRKNGVSVPALGEGLRIHPHFGVFSPVRGEYVALLQQAPLPEVFKIAGSAFDIGVGTGVLSAVLALRGAQHIVATDLSERALACARDNLIALGLQHRVELLQTNLFPPGQATLIVCNPPWLPARPTSMLEQAVYDEGSQMLKGFLSGLATHLCEGGEGWLILSDLAEHLGLRSREELLSWIAAAGLTVLGRHDARPKHPKTQDTADPLHQARSREVTSLWRLAPSTFSRP